MDIKDILSVGLTAEDFEVCIEGLDAIPEKKKAEEGLRGVMMMMLGSMGSDMRRKEMENIMEKKMKEVERQCTA